MTSRWYDWKANISILCQILDLFRIFSENFLTVPYMALFFNPFRTLPPTKRPPIIKQDGKISNHIPILKAWKVNFWHFSLQKMNLLCLQNQRKSIRTERFLEKLRHPKRLISALLKIHIWKEPFHTQKRQRFGRDNAINLVTLWEQMIFFFAKICIFIY